MSKVLIMVRASTEKQSVEDQHNEMAEFCRAEGYADEDMVWIEDKGASAAKVNEKYRQMIEDVKAEIEKEPQIDCFACWHLNRAFRTETVYIELKEFLVSHKVQMLIKNPYLRLLNPDGTVNKGMELAVGLLAILAKQDTEERKEKMHRSKKSKQARGQWCGGYYAYGYMLDENKFLVECPEDAEIVRLIFNLYSTGKYSYASLAQELHDRGITYTNHHCNKPLTNAYFKTYSIAAIIKNKIYLGEKRNLTYPPLISQEIFDKCNSIREQNNVKQEKGNGYNFASKLLICPECGRYLYYNGYRYECWSHGTYRFGYKAEETKCSSDVGIRGDVIDGLLWNHAATLHMNHLLSLNENSEKEYLDKIAVVEQKIAAANDKLSAVDVKKKKIVDSYIEGYFSKSDRDNRLQKVEAEAEGIRGTLNKLGEERSRLKSMIASLNDDVQEVERLVSTLNGVIDITDAKTMYDIVHKHIKAVRLERFDFEKKYRRNGTPQKPNGIKITVEQFNGKSVVFAYLPYVRRRDNVYRLVEGKWVVWDFETIRREGDKAYTALTEPRE